MTDSNEKNNTDTEEKVKFYENARKYWETIPSTVDGMLGGLGYFSEMDVHESKNFLQKILPNARGHALDCGAGIGRVTRELLLPFGFEKVDLVEQDAKFIEKSKTYLADFNDRIEQRFNVGLQDFDPPPDKYDVVWSQWVLGHLTDMHFVRFFQRIGESLRENGVIFVKENVTSSGRLEMDEEDSSVTRPLDLIEELFEEAGLKCLDKRKQKKCPLGLYPIYMFALVPDRDNQ